MEICTVKIFFDESLDIMVATSPYNNLNFIRNLQNVLKTLRKGFYVVRYEYFFCNFD